jgi:hypothetical protein
MLGHLAVVGQNCSICSRVRERVVLCYILALLRRRDAQDILRRQAVDTIWEIDQSSDCDVQFSEHDGDTGY